MRMASTASFTSCTRKICAPFINAAVLSTEVPLRASAGVLPKSLYIIDLRDIPTNNGSSNK